MRHQSPPQPKGIGDTKPQKTVTNIPLLASKPPPAERHWRLGELFVSWLRRRIRHQSPPQPKGIGDPATAPALPATTRWASKPPPAERHWRRTQPRRFQETRGRHQSPPQPKGIGDRSRSEDLLARFCGASKPPPAERHWRHIAFFMVLLRPGVGIKAPPSRKALETRRGSWRGSSHG